jgi:hypothetical protein
MKYQFILFLTLVVGLILNGCEQNPVPAEQELEVESLVKEHAAFGWEINRLIASGQEISGLTQNSQYDEHFFDFRYVIKREKQLKNWHREWKLNLIKKMNPGLRDLKSKLYHNLDSEILKPCSGQASSE